LTVKGAATRARILDAAAALILTNGVAGTGIEDVRKAAGVSGSQMTHYFQDKRTLLHEVIAWQAEANLALHEDPVLQGFATFASLRLWADMVVQRQSLRNCEGGCSFGSLAGQLVESDPEARADLADGYRRWLDLLRSGLATMRSNGDLVTAAKPDELAYALLGSMQGGMLIAQTMRDPAPLEAAFASGLERVAAFASSPARARRAMRLTGSRSQRGPRT
jgi:AcrR family transcriptional regulator